MKDLLGLFPFFCHHLNIVSDARFPIWRLSSVGSVPQYAICDPVQSFLSKPSKSLDWFKKSTFNKNILEIWFYTIHNLSPFLYAKFLFYQRMKSKRKYLLLKKLFFRHFLWYNVDINIVKIYLFNKILDKWIIRYFNLVTIK